MTDRNQLFAARLKWRGSEAHTPYKCNQKNAFGKRIVFLSVSDSSLCYFATTLQPAAQLFDNRDKIHSRGYKINLKRGETLANPTECDMEVNFCTKSSLQLFLRITALSICPKKSWKIRVLTIWLSFPGQKFWELLY